MEIEPKLLRRMTVRRVLDALRERGPSSRADLTRHAGISAPTISKVIATLLEKGLVEEGSPQRAAAGRPRRLLRLARDSAHVVGVVIDVPRSTIVVAGLDGELLPEMTRTFATPGDYAALVDSLATELERLGLPRKSSRLGVGISAPGLLDRRRGAVVMSPNLPQTDGRTPARDLEERLGAPCVVVQESHALCLAESRAGGARGLADFAMLDVSTGLGLGVVSGGRLLEGHSGMAGELGHVIVEPHGRRCGCGRRGCLETLATDTAFRAEVAERLGREVDLDEALALAAGASGDAVAALDRVVDALATATSIVINLFNPSTLFVHGRVLSARPGVFDRVIEETRARTLRPSFEDCRIVEARGSKRQGAIAAILERLEEGLGPQVLG